jgi:hypothetical protein
LTGSPVEQNCRGGIDESSATGLCQSEDFIRANPVRRTARDP